MLRLSLLLGAAIYAGLVILPERLPARDGVADPADPPNSAPKRGSAAQAPRDILITADGRHLPISAVISPTETVGGALIALASTRPAETVTVSASVGLAEPPLVEVTGRQVNLRDSPSTQGAVLTALGQGERAELIGADGNGWVLIRAVATGIEGYMSDRFVAVVN
jgi:hypothetical protein